MWRFDDCHGACCTYVRPAAEIVTTRVPASTCAMEDFCRGLTVGWCATSPGLMLGSAVAVRNPCRDLPAPGGSGTRSGRDRIGILRCQEPFLAK